MHPSPSPPPDDRPDWQTTAGKVLLCLLPVALGVSGLVTGTSVVLIPGGHQSGQAGQSLVWTVSGPLGRVVALGLLALGLGGLAKLRATGRSPRASWAIGLGLLLALGGSLIHGTEAVVRRFVQ